MPAAALATVATNAARALAANPTVRATAMEYISKATGGRVGTTDQATKFANSSKGGLAVVTEGLVKAGLPVNVLFTDVVLAELQDADMRKLYDRLRAEFNTVYGAIDAASPLKPDSGASRDMIALETLNFMRNFFGVQSDAAMRKLHVHLKLFTAMDENLVAQAARLRQAAIGGRGV